MKTSQLQAIIKRLEGMLTEKVEPNIRLFEKEGQERCQVTYHPETDSFELLDHAVKESFEFDDIDLTAIEIFELLQ